MIQQKFFGRWFMGLGVLIFAMAPVSAGVVFEIEVTDHEQSPPKTEEMEVAAEGKNLKMDVAPGRDNKAGHQSTMVDSAGEMAVVGSAADMAADAAAGDDTWRQPGGQPSDDYMVYNGERREMVVVDHRDRSYQVMDIESIRKGIGDSNTQIMSSVQEALKNVPAEQRAQLEGLFKGGIPGATMPGMPVERPASEIRKTGERATKAGYPCVKYEVIRDGRKTRELWVTDWDNVEGGSEVAGTFEDMADFFREMMEAIPNMGGGPGLDDNIYVNIDEVDGFPVVVKEFDPYDGSLESESTLRSAQRRTLDPDAFEPPSGYKRRSMYSQ